MKENKVNGINTIQLDVIQSALELLDYVLIYERKHGNFIKSYYEGLTNSLKSYDQWDYEKRELEEEMWERERQSQIDPHQDFLDGLDEKSYQEDIDYNYMNYDNWRSFKNHMKTEQENRIYWDGDTDEDELTDEEREAKDKRWQTNRDIEEKLNPFVKLNFQKEQDKFTNNELEKYYEDFNEFIMTNKDFQQKYNREKDDFNRDFTNNLRKKLIAIKSKVYNNAPKAVNLPISLNSINEAITKNNNSNHYIPEKEGIAEQVLFATESILTKLFAYTSDEDDYKFFDKKENEPNELDINDDEY